MEPSDPIHSCCFTGHRAIAPADYDAVAIRVNETIRALYARGFRDFYAGGALGFDYIASITLLNLRLLLSDLRLHLALPCPDYDRKWTERNRLLYQRIRKNADDTVFVCPSHTASCMFERNRYMVDRSAVCVCWMTKTSGGTAYTVSYAESLGREILNLASLTADHN